MLFSIGPESTIAEILAVQNRMGKFNRFPRRQPQGQQ